MAASQPKAWVGYLGTGDARCLCGLLLGTIKLQELMLEELSVSFITSLQEQRAPSLLCEHCRAKAPAGEPRTGITSSHSILCSAAEGWGRSLLPASTHGNGMAAQPRFQKPPAKAPRSASHPGEVSLKRPCFFPEGEDSALSECGGS